MGSDDMDRHKFEIGVPVRFRSLQRIRGSKSGSARLALMLDMVVTLPAGGRHRSPSATAGRKAIEAKVTRRLAAIFVRPLAKAAEHLE
jgi:hypothetical protein